MSLELVLGCLALSMLHDWQAGRRWRANALSMNLLCIATASQLAVDSAFKSSHTYMNSHEYVRAVVCLALLTYKEALTDVFSEVMHVWRCSGADRYVITIKIVVFWIEDASMRANATQLLEWGGCIQHCSRHWHEWCQCCTLSVIRMKTTSSTFGPQRKLLQSNVDNICIYCWHQ